MFLFIIESASVNIISIQDKYRGLFLTNMHTL